MELKNKWEELYDFSQDEARYDELCAEQCYNDPSRQIEIAKELSRLNKEELYSYKCVNRMQRIIKGTLTYKDVNMEELSIWIH